MQGKLRTHIETIVPLTDDEFSYILSLFITKTYKKNQFLILEGESVQYAYLVVSGLLKLVYTDDTGKEHIVSFAMEDWWETDFPAYFNQTKATMSLQCLEDTNVFCLSLENYQKICFNIQKMESFFLKKSNAGFIGSQHACHGWI